jgi:serine acetyltransferase
VATHLARAAYAAAQRADRSRFAAAAVTLTALAYALQYFKGLREECGSLGGLLCEIRQLRRASAPAGRLAECLAAIRADHDTLRHYRAKYHGETVPPGRLPIDLVRKVGFQMLVWYRVMRLFRAWRVPLAPMVMSRLIRHLYGAEMHWDARLAPGVSLVHGVGLVLSHAAEVGAGCILFQNVTLGESTDPVTGVVGAPRLGPRVHVGPGASLLGPIEVGADSKVAAGAVLMRSVSPGSLVVPPTAVVTSRRDVPRARLTRMRPAVVEA